MQKLKNTPHNFRDFRTASFNCFFFLSKILSAVISDNEKQQNLTLRNWIQWMFDICACVKIDQVWTIWLLILFRIAAAAVTQNSAEYCCHILVTNDSHPLTFDYDLKSKSCHSSRLPGPSRVPAAGSGASRSPGSSNLNRRSQSFNSIDKSKPLQYTSGNDRGNSCLLLSWRLHEGSTR